MMALKLTITLMAALLAVTAHAAFAVAPTATAPALKVVVSVPPLKGLVEPILPAGSTVDILIPPGVSEHGYDIPPSKLAALNSADIVITVGLDLEPQIEKFLKANPRDGRTHIEFAAAAGIETGDHAKHEHKPGEACDHAIDPHLWLDPILCKKLVSEVAAQVSARAPWGKRKGPDSDAFATKLAQHLDRIDRVDQKYTAASQLAARRTIVVAHDAYGHLCKRYNLTSVAIAGLTAAEPSPGDIKRAADEIKKQSLTHVFVEPQLSPKAVEQLARATGTKVLTLDPLGDGDWFKLMDQNLAALKQAMGEKTPEPASK
jgi:zinc transport system substrate-binding protein